jgi:hypothetical protein
LGESTFFAAFSFEQSDGMDVSIKKEKSHFYKKKIPRA